MRHNQKWPQVYTGPTIKPSLAGAGKVGIKTGTKGRLTGETKDDLVEFIPSWGEGWLSIWLNASEVHDRGPEELERLL